MLIDAKSDKNDFICSMTYEEHSMIYNEESESQRTGSLTAAAK